MNKPISRPWHGLTDYNYIAVVSASPKEFGFEDEKNAVLMTRVLTTTILVSSILTRAEWGFLRIMPYKMHLLLDTLGGVLALSAPWLFGFSGNSKARNAFLAFGLTGILAGTLSEPQEMPEDPKGQGAESA